ncbi:MAG: hypothetical protein V4550_10265 [Gemmatimonadota bacterium]
MIRTLRSTAFLAVAGSLTLAAPARAQTPWIPDRLADSTFWRMMNDFSEPWGTFRSENFVSNETSYQWIIPELQKVVKPGAVYLGVAPDQNFTYIVNLRPKIAFIVDIRHQNAMQHMLYKALLETSATRAEFLAKLFSRKPLEGVDTNSTAIQLFTALANTRVADSALYRQNLAAVKDRLMKVHRFALSDSEQVSLSCVYGAFYSQGPGLTYNYASECRNPGPYGGGFGGGRPGGGGGGGGFGGGMPSYVGMMVESNGLGVDQGYLATEANFRTLKDYEERNLIVPLTGNFAGPKALQTVGKYARDHGATIGAFYVSNVEQYLWQQGDEAPRFYKNVATLPLDAGSTFIRSYSGGGGGGFYAGNGPLQLKQQSGRSMQLIGSIKDLLTAFEKDELHSWIDVIARSRQ